MNFNIKCSDTTQIAMPNWRIGTEMKKCKHWFHEIFINIYVGLHIMIQANIQTNLNIHKHTKSTHSHIYTPTNKKTYIY